MRKGSFSTKKKKLERTSEGKNEKIENETMLRKSNRDFAREFERNLKERGGKNRARDWSKG